MKMINTNYASFNNRVSSENWQTSSAAKDAQVKDTSSQVSKVSTFGDTGVILH